MKIADFCAELHNWFDIKRSFGKYTIEGGKLIIPDMLEGQYFRICDSVFNDGVYQYPVSDLTDETFDGAIWYMAMPKDALSLVDDITEWETQNASTLNSPYASESFGGYSYTKASGSGANGGDGTVTAFSHFADRLKRYRKTRDL